jgi:hypothetical protein
LLGGAGLRQAVTMTLQTAATRDQLTKRPELLSSGRLMF